MEKKVNFIYYRRLNGHVEFQEYLDGLSVKDAAKLESVIERVEKIGIPAAIKIKDVKKIDKYIYELRARFDKTQMRGMYFHFEDNQYFITHGFTKKTAQTPLREIIHAHDLRQEFLERMK